MKKRNWKKFLSAFLASALVLSLVVPTVPQTVKAETFATDLIISEYVEGSSFNKAIELYNGTGTTIDLSEYTLELYSNGASTVSQQVTLSGSLANGGTYVLYHKDANEAIKNKGNLENSSVINFNGDDPVVLKKLDVVVDSIGKIGVRDIFGADVTLVRKSSITTGDSIIDDDFDRSVEWTVLQRDDISNLGIHVMGGTPVDPVDPVDPEPILPISIAEARSKAVGETVTIKGTVAA
ncbi:MAG: lamin tail domain-containing protein, partial [Lysinibacillus sp.]